MLGDARCHCYKASSLTRNFKYDCIRFEVFTVVKIHVVVSYVVTKVADQVTAPNLRMQAVRLPRLLVPVCWTMWCDNTQCHSISHMLLDVEPNCRPTWCSYKAVYCVKLCTSVVNCVGDSSTIAWLVPSPSTSSGHICFMVSTTFTSHINSRNLSSTMLISSGLFDEFGSI